MKFERQPSGPVPPHAVDVALNHVHAGGRLVVATYSRVTIIDRRVLKRFGAEWIIRDEGDGYRLRSGKSSVYLMPGQLHYAA